LLYGVLSILGGITNPLAGVIIVGTFLRTVNHFAVSSTLSVVGEDDDLVGIRISYSCFFNTATTRFPGASPLSNDLIVFRSINMIHTRARQIFFLADLVDQRAASMTVSTCLFGFATHRRRYEKSIWRSRHLINGLTKRTRAGQNLGLHA
jgi:hypothetical protein